MQLPTNIVPLAVCVRSAALYLSATPHLSCHPSVLFECCRAEVASIKRQYEEDSDPKPTKEQLVAALVRAGCFAAEDASQLRVPEDVTRFLADCAGVDLTNPEDLMD